MLNPNGYCSDCAKNVGKEKAKQTNLEKYGVEFTTQSKEVKDKMKKSCLEKYGVEHISHCKEIIVTYSLLDIVPSKLSR